MERQHMGTAATQERLVKDKMVSLKDVCLRQCGFGSTWILLPFVTVFATARRLRSVGDSCLGVPCI